MPDPLVRHYLTVVDLIELVVRRRLPGWVMFGKGLKDVERLAIAQKLADAHTVSVHAEIDGQEKRRITLGLLGPAGSGAQITGDDR